MLSLAQSATLACLLEVTAPKPGNVHRGADFENLSFSDFVVSAAVSGPIVTTAGMERSVGEAIRLAVAATHRLVGKNTNLGTLLLLGPLAAVPREQTLQAGIGKVLAQLTPDDAAAIYEAIRLAQPGGMGKVEKYDIEDAPPSDILDAMRLAADRDLVARQYVTDFEIVLGRVTPALVAGRQRGWSINDTIIHTQQQLLAEYSDSLIERKCGAKMAAEVRGWARAVVGAGGPGDENYELALADFDFWLRCDGHRRNPGTTADLIAAGLFAVLRDDDGTWLESKQ